MRIPRLAALAVAVSVAVVWPAVTTRGVARAAQAKPRPSAAPQRKTPAAKVAEPFKDAAALATRRQAAEQRRLFQRDEPLAFTLAADFKAISRDRNVVRTFSAAISVKNDAGALVKVPVTLRTRGNFRRLDTTCASPPLFVEFDKARVKDTVFDGQSKLKLIVNCNETPRFDQLVLLEYAAYRMLNVLTPQSFRARLASATYADAKSGRTISTHNAVFVEDDDDVAAWMEGRSVALTGLQFKDFDQASLNLVSMFEYLLGNPDYSVSFMHNVRMVQTPAGVRYLIAWDFDFTGFVDPRYDSPMQQVRDVIASARVRKYLGPCHTAEEWEPTLRAFREKRTELLAAVDGLPGLDEAERRRVDAYLGEFFTTIGSAELVKREFIDTCHDRPTL